MKVIPAPRTAIQWEWGLVFLANNRDAKWVVVMILAIIASVEAA